MVAEKLGIPSVLFAPHSMLSLISEKITSSTGLMKLFRSRMDSFVLAKRFMQMNKVCFLPLLSLLFTECNSQSFPILSYRFEQHLAYHCFVTLPITLRKQQ